MSLKPTAACFGQFRLPTDCTVTSAISFSINLVVNGLHIRVGGGHGAELKDLWRMLNQGHDGSNCSNF